MKVTVVAFYPDRETYDILHVFGSTASLEHWKQSLVWECGLQRGEWFVVSCGEGWRFVRWCDDEASAQAYASARPFDDLPFDIEEWQVE